MSRRNFMEFDFQSDENRFQWLLKEAHRVRQIRQEEMRKVRDAARESDLAWRRPIWLALDEQLREHEEGARQNNTQKFKGSQSRRRE